ncbi:hypothetical protein ACJ41O_006386 [Fusarium nematophilum]
MRSARKLRACYPCTKGKRRCDKAQPACGRCQEMDIECRYAPVRRRRAVMPEEISANDQFQATVGEDALGSAGPGFADDVDSLVDIQQWTTGLVDLVPVHDMAEPQPHMLNDPPMARDQPSPTLPEAPDPLSTRPPEPQDLALLQPHPHTTSITSSAAKTSFFLRSDSWAIRHLSINCPGFSSSVCLNYVRGLHCWFTDWVTSCHSPFIHRQLYADTGLPQPMRDAFMSITAHNTRTPENEDVVDEMLECNVSALLKSYPEACLGGVEPKGDAASNLDTRQHLARTQALYIHLVLALFSTSIRARANAERHVQTLLSWTRQLWDAALFDKDLCQSPEICDIDAIAGSAAAVDALFDGDPLPRLWRSWVLSESIRRMWLLATSTIGLYLTMRQQWVECQGGINFTTHKGLWAAESASSWAKACKSTDPLFVCSLDGESLFRTVNAAEVDEMARNLFTIMWGVERVESWVARTAGSDSGVRVWY